MAESSRATDALLTEHFRYTPLTLIDDIINAVNTIVYRGIEAIENGLLNIPPKTLGFPNNGDGENTEASDEIEHGVHQLETLLEATVDKAFDKFEIYTLRNILTVPDEVAGWVRLGHYENLQFPAPPSSDPKTHRATPTPESLLHLRRQLSETRKLNTALRATHSKNAALLTDLHSILSSPDQNTPTAAQIHSSPSSSSLAFLTRDPHTSTAPSITPLTTTTQFLTSQLPALRALLTDLRPRLRKMQQEGDKNLDWDREREERRRYIEGGVGRVVGFGSGRGGSGELGAGVERRGVGEVEGLEEVVGGLR